jgi:hypothetical protein
VFSTDEAGVNSSRIKERPKEYHPNLNTREEMLQYKGYVFHFWQSNSLPLPSTPLCIIIKHLRYLPNFRYSSPIPPSSLMYNHQRQENHTFLFLQDVGSAMISGTLIWQCLRLAFFSTQSYFQAPSLILFSDANLKDFQWALWNIWPRRYTVSGCSTSELEERFTVITQHA